MQRIGLFGGSFDPVHIGHLLVGQSAREELRLDRLFFILAAQSPFKPGSKPIAPHQRLKMLRLALSGWDWCEVDDQEIRRGGISYTIDTVRDYAARLPDAELFYLIGADHASQLIKWRDAEELAKLVQFVVISRPGQPSTSLPEPFRGQQLVGFPMAASSSQIRERVKARLPLEPLVPAAVAEMIRNNGLYL
jgi:nicotinate-nucleotide adenylyltransferase